MLAIISFIVILTLSILVTRVASVALAHTGLSREAARFQARSAFTGVGFTTSESEKVVHHPVRRRILLLLMLLGNAGVVTAMSSLLLTFVNEGEGGMPLWMRVVLLVTGVVALWALASSHWVDRHLSHVISRALDRTTKLDVRDYASLLHLTGEYRVSELEVEPGDWLANRTLSDLALRDEGVIVLGIERGNDGFVGAPGGDTELRPGDTLLLYGRAPLLESLDERETGAGGDRAHDEAVREQSRIAAHQENENEK